MELTQTQPMASQCPQSLQQDQGVYARMVFLHKPGKNYEIRRDQKEVCIGRHPDCDIFVEDKRVSAKHVRVYCDEAQRYFLEELSANGCWINEHYMKKGDTRALQHGDEISICVRWGDTTQSPFAAYIFRLACHQSGESPLVGAAAQVAAQMDTTGNNSKLVSEQWVHDRWDMRNILGSGNFSEVRLGLHVESGDRRAVKVIDKKKFMSFQTKRESHLSLSSEADVLTSLSHPGIVKFYEYFESENHLYLIMEYLAGGDLLQCIMEHGCFPEAAARKHFRELCRAVRYLHDKKIVHRDLKPENILLTSRVQEEAHLKIADFGLARKNFGSADCRTFCGTPHYFAPEVIYTFRDKDCTKQESGQVAGYGTQADMWSLGVILYIMLSGIPPFEDEGLYEQIIEGKYEFDVREWTTVSPEAKQLVKSLMTVNPRDRLTIHQAMAHPWFRMAEPPSPAPLSHKSSCQSPTKGTVRAFSSSAEGEQLVKRQRSDAPAPAVEQKQLTGEMRVVNTKPLGA
eukprot:gnl/TRDRNA2_/TRDRNA2_157603_c0_seq3.p1 gnl/TRDRNA2_/TRDRNA2_157603_c0~~gnl/TRDRNA2_/TRDRNA2_157603_c0_seq3.p1  ORF type:complete len:514 (-),score=82.32 gnl/TRDRNA2_/TRDRNA2_157603_c0_seq3:16-1557(-)